MRRNGTLGEIAYHELKELILSGKFHPGERLYYEEIGKLLDISPSPIKEAFLLLKNEGLVEIIARKGTYVKKLSKQEIINAYEIREVLEGLSARLAARKATPENIEELEKLCQSFQQCVKNKDLSECLMADIEFHTMLMKISGNEQLEGVLTHSLYTNLFGSAGLEERYLSEGYDTIIEHNKILEAIIKGDEKKAETVMRAQIRKGCQIILNSYNNKKIE